MLDFNLQLSLLTAAASTYVDDRRVELASTDFATSNEEFVLNITYLKREKLIDLSSISTRNAPAEGASNYVVARVSITHAGMKTLADLSAVKTVINKY